MSTRDENVERHRVGRKRKSQAEIVERKPKQRKIERVIADAPVAQTDFAWGAAAIGRVINRKEKQVFHLWYSGALNGAVRKINGQLVGCASKLRALMGGE